MVSAGEAFGYSERKAQRARELRIHGLAACLAVFRKRPQAVRKVYLRADREATCSELLAYCRAQHLAYRYLSDEDLARLTETGHHEGLALEIDRLQPVAFESIAGALALDQVPALLLLLDGVGNPHNLGAILRACAHFGVRAVLLPPEARVELSAAVYRTAEGGAECTPLVRLRDTDADLAELDRLGFTCIGSVVAGTGATSIHATRWPERTLLVVGAEGSGISPAWLERCDRYYTIPGSGLVDSLNVGQATAVLLAAHAGSLARSALSGRPGA